MKVKLYATVALVLAAALPAQAGGPIRARWQTRYGQGQSQGTPMYGANTPPAQPGIDRGDGSFNALAEVNACRAAEGLPAFEEDVGLTAGAASCALTRARFHLFGHTGNDFAHLPPGVAGVSGGGAYPPALGWRTCLTYSSGYTKAGAAYAWGDDGKRYMTLFVGR